MKWKCGVTQVIDGVSSAVAADLVATDNGVSLEIYLSGEKAANAVRDGKYKLRIRAWNPALDVEVGPAADPDKMVRQPLRLEMDRLLERIKELEKRCGIAA